MRKIKCNKGSLSDLSLGVVIALVSLFIGLYMITKVANIQSAKDLYDYSYTTISNNSVRIVSLAGILYNNTLTVASISGETTTKTLFINVSNANTTSNFTVSVYMNGVSLGTFLATANTLSTHTFTDVNYINGNSINISANVITASATNVTTNMVRIYYPSGTTETSFGEINTNLTENTSTVFDVIILVIIIVSLGVAIEVLRGFGTPSGSVSTI
jgi:hypothetical protein